DLQDLLAHVPPPYLVPMTRVLSDASAHFQRSAGLPRLVPGMNSTTPRSSTHRPQLIHSSLEPLFSAAWIRAAIQSLGRGWSSWATSRPWTALAWGACLEKARATAPS